MSTVVLLSEHSINYTLVNRRTESMRRQLSPPKYYKQYQQTIPTFSKVIFKHTYTDETINSQVHVCSFHNIII